MGLKAVAAAAGGGGGALVGDSLDIGSGNFTVDADGNVALNGNITGVTSTIDSGGGDILSNDGAIDAGAGEIITTATVTGGSVVATDPAGGVFGLIKPSNPDGTAQVNNSLSMGTGAPNNAQGADGDFYFRSDGTVAGNTVMYHKEGGAWVALTTA